VQTYAFFTLHRPSSGLQAQAKAQWRGAWQRSPGELVPARLESRDPFVFRWRDEWRMLLAQPPPWTTPDSHPARLMLFGSADLETWRELAPIRLPSALGELFETPLLRRIPVSGEAEEEWPWLLAVGVVDRRGGGAACGTRAWFGRFDGGGFDACGRSFALDYGPDFYAPAAWAGTGDDEVVVTGWCNSWGYARRLPSTGWSGGAHALPRRVTAVHGAGGWSLRQQPATLPSVRAERIMHPGEHIIEGQYLLSLEGGGVVKVGDLTLTLADDTVTLERDCAVRELRDAGFHGRWTAPRSAARLEWFIDGCIAELFSADGAVWMSALTLRTASDALELGHGVTATLRSLG
jgi:sucrose-6-phosphate hydrolase SacC (GH32 family)